MIDQLLNLEWYLALFLVIGFLVILIFVVYPAVYAILYSLGYLGFNLLNVDWKAARKRPDLLLRYIFRHWLRGLWEGLTLPCDGISAGPYHWRPLFRYWIDKD